MLKKLFITIFLLLAISYSCKKENTQTVPYIYVDFYVKPNATSDIHLNTVGGWEYVTGGYSGILIYRQSTDAFLAYDRACPYDYGNGCRVTVETSFTTAIDSCCKSRFIIAMDGSPVSGSAATVSLKQYRTAYDGTYLHVYN